MPIKKRRKKRKFDLKKGRLFKLATKQSSAEVSDDEDVEFNPEDCIKSNDSDDQTDDAFDLNQISSAASIFKRNLRVLK